MAPDQEGLLHGILAHMSNSGPWYEPHKLIGALVLSFGFVVVISTIAETASQASTAAHPAEVSQATASSTAAAVQEFNELMTLSKHSNLVSSYEFSASERVIYVTDVWDGLTVTFKKDFLAKVAMLHSTITGYQFFEVHNDRSNEKVGEVTLSDRWRSITRSWRWKRHERASIDASASNPSPHEIR
jgi:hypothetical protein